MKLTDTIKLATKGFKPADIRRFDENGLDSETILALSGAGYSVNDVDELITMASEGQKTEEPKKEPDSKMPDNELGHSGAETPDDVDYKAKFEEVQKKLEETNNMVKKLQDLNASKNLQNEPAKSPREMVDDALRNLY